MDVILELFSFRGRANRWWFLAFGLNPLRAPAPVDYLEG
jgi:hypothetical protein